MEIDLNDPNEFTLENVRRLIASKDDSEDRQLRVTVDGIAFISDDIAAENLQGIHFRFETWHRGNDYLGGEASKDEKWVTRIHEALKTNWPTPITRYLDVY